MCVLLILFDGAFLNTWVPLGKPDSAVGIAARYDLGDQGIEFQLGRDFPYPSRATLRPNQPPVQMGTGSLRRGQSGLGVTLTAHPHLQPRLKRE